MKRLGLLAALVLLAGGTALACIHPPRDYKGTVDSTTQEAIIFWRAGREELILKVNYALKGNAPAPAMLGWVIPVPTKPDNYAVTSPKVFEDAFHLSETYKLPERSLVKEDKPPANSLVLEKVTVGEYDITVLKASGADAAMELNDWLVKEGFSAYPVADMKYYTERKWTFLAVKINKEEAAKSLAKHGGMRPLRISFAADQIYYPLKFSSASAPFQVLAHVFTERPLSPEEVRAYRLLVKTAGPGGRGFGSSRVSEEELRFNKGYWKKLARELDDKGKEAQERLELITKEDAKAETELYRLSAELQKSKLGKFAQWYLTSFEGPVNGTNNRLAEWKTDLQLTVAQ